MSLLPADRYDIAHIGFLLGDPGRAAMLLALLHDVARPASELARIAAVSAPTASSHLSRLTQGGLVRVERLGRHRYYRLSGLRVAELLETLARVRPLSPSRRSRLALDPARAALIGARLCYRHLAGRLGVALADAFIRARFVRRAGAQLVLTPTGASRLDAVGLAGARPAGKPCLDWTERRHHIGGALGVRIARLLLDERWIVPEREGRAVRVTAAGKRGLATLGVEPAQM